MKERFDSAGIPLEKRYSVLHPSHVTDLLRLDVKAFKEMMDFVSGQPKRFAGFGMLQTSITAIYDYATLEKKSFAAPDGADDVFSSPAFYGDGVMKADGEVYMYIREDAPEERGTVAGFDRRFIALPIRGKGTGAVISAKA